MLDKNREESRKKRYLVGLYKTERMHHLIFKDLAAKEKNKDLKYILERLSNTEEKHARMWARIIEIDGIKLPKRISKLFVFAILVLRDLIGLILAVKAMETFEDQLEKKFSEVEKHVELSGKEKQIVEMIIKDEMKNETPLKNKIIEYNSILRNIRDIMIGMNDGLVEVLAAIAGLGAALQTPTLILMGGIIIALSGTLSMSGSAYLSTSYETHIGKVQEKKKRGARSSAFYVGGAYVIGSIFPLLPFILGFGSYEGIALAILFTGIVLVLIATIIAVISNISVKRNVAKTLVISIGSAFVTMALGAYARSILHITI